MNKKAYIHTLEGAIVLMLVLSYLNLVLPGLQVESNTYETKDRIVIETLQTLLYSGEMDGALSSHNTTEIANMLKSILPYNDLNITLDYVNVDAYPMESSEINISKYVSSREDLIIDMHPSQESDVSISVNNHVLFSGKISEFTNVNASDGLSDIKNITISSSPKLNYVVIRVVEHETTQISGLRKSAQLTWWLNDTTLVVIGVYVR